MAPLAAATLTRCASPGSLHLARELFATEHTEATEFKEGTI